MADEIEWWEAEGMPYGGVYHCSAAVAENVLGPITQDIPNLAVTAEDFIVSGDTVAVVARDTALEARLASGWISVVHLWDVRDDKIARFRQFADTAEFLEVVLGDHHPPGRRTKSIRRGEGVSPSNAELLARG